MRNIARLARQRQASPVRRSITSKAYSPAKAKPSEIRVIRYQYSAGAKIRPNEFVLPKHMRRGMEIVVEEQV